MGMLIARHYSSAMFADLADHTYVECGAGRRAWGCWGGKSGGQEIRRGSGSTSQANEIAGPNERAGITCYLINGVCHQAANRILFPAKILVTGARGYGVSEALFGPYGRPRGFIGLCNAPFDQHSGISGDFDECAEVSPLRSDDHRIANYDNARDRDYIEQVLEIYARADRVRMGAMSLNQGDDQDAFVTFQRELFRYRVISIFGSSLRTQSFGSVLEIRETTEKRRIDLERAYKAKELKPSEFADMAEEQVAQFQTDMANTLREEDYQQLFGVARDERIMLFDPDVVIVEYRAE